MVKKAVVTDNTVCVDSKEKKESFFFDGEKVSSTDGTGLVKLSKILENKLNELENTKPVH